jgi:hypothetical protein
MVLPEPDAADENQRQQFENGGSQADDTGLPHACDIDADHDPDQRQPCRCRQHRTGSDHRHHCSQVSGKRYGNGGTGHPKAYPSTPGNQESGKIAEARARIGVSPACNGYAACKVAKHHCNGKRTQRCYCQAQQPNATIRRHDCWHHENR